MNSELIKRQHSVVIVGLGTIGSYVALLLARLLEIRHLIIVDPDTYEARNLTGQNIATQHVGTSKVEAIASACTAIRPELDVTTHMSRVEDVPMANLTAELIIGCVDSPEARQSINFIASRLGMPWLDSGIRADGLLARVAQYQPGAEYPCMECRWGNDHYAQLGATYPCDGKIHSRTKIAPTAAPAEIGALGAAYAVMAARRMLGGNGDFAGQELFVNCEQHTMHTARFSLNSECRFDHQSFRLQHEDGITVESRLNLIAENFGSRNLSVPGHSFVFEAACIKCKETESTSPRLTRAAFDLPRCSTCGGERLPVGYTIRDKLAVSGRWLALTLREIGVRDGDILSLHIANDQPAQIPLHITFGSNP